MNAIKLSGTMLLVLGVGADFYFFFIFDPTVSGYYNEGLLNTRLCGIVGGLASWGVGTMMLLFARRDGKPSTMPIIHNQQSVSPVSNEEFERSQKLSEDPRTQWLRDCVRADREGRPRPPKPAA